MKIDSADYFQFTILIPSDQIRMLRSATASTLELTTAPIKEPPAPSKGTHPEFVRLPKPGTCCPWTGLSRSKMNELVLPCEANQYRPPVQSISLRKKGSKRGVRLVHYDSLLKYLNDRANPAAEGDD